MNDLTELPEGEASLVIWERTIADMSKRDLKQLIEEVRRRGLVVERDEENGAWRIRRRILGVDE